MTISIDGVVIPQLQPQPYLQQPVHKESTSGVPSGMSSDDPSLGISSLNTTQQPQKLVDILQATIQTLNQGT